MTNLVILHAPEDRRFADDLRTHLTRQRDRGISCWSSGDLLPGERVVDQVKRRVEQADLVVLLVSADLLCSDYFPWGRELLGGVHRSRLLPVQVRPVDWHAEPLLSSIEAIPRSPICMANDPHEAWRQVTSQIRKQTSQEPSGRFRSLRTDQSEMDLAIVLPSEDAYREVASEVCDRILRADDKAGYFVFDSPTGGLLPYRCMAINQRCERPQDIKEPLSYVSVGLALSLSTEARLGDVLAATSVGDVPTYTELAKSAANLEFTDRKLFFRWRTGCALERSALLPRALQESLMEGTVLRPENSLLHGSLSTSDGFYKRALAQELEPTLDPQLLSRALVLRGISQNREQRNLQGLVYRRLALRNCIRLLFTLMDAMIFPWAGHHRAVSG